jgi:hypothetical protein
MPDTSLANNREMGRWAIGAGVRDRRPDRDTSGRRQRRSRLRGTLEAVHPQPRSELIGQETRALGCASVLSLEGRSGDCSNHPRRAVPAPVPARCALERHLRHGRPAWLSQIASTKRVEKAHTGFELVPPRARCVGDGPVAEWERRANRRANRCQNVRLAAPPQSGAVRFVREDHGGDGREGDVGEERDPLAQVSRRRRQRASQSMEASTRSIVRSSGCALPARRPSSNSGPGSSSSGRA